MTTASCDIYYEKERRKEIQELVERIFFIAQKQALENDLYVKKIEDGSYIWVKNPWKEGLKSSIGSEEKLVKDMIKDFPLYNPQKDKFTKEIR